MSFEDWFSIKLAECRQNNDMDMHKALHAHKYWYEQGWQACAEQKDKRIAELEAQNKELVEALEALIADLNMRANKLKQEDACGVVACGNGVWIKANEALAKVKGE